MAGVGMVVPERRVSNAEIAAGLGVEESWIARRTGTHTRPWADAGDRLSDLAARAGHEALARAGIVPEELDLVVVATSTADEMSPNAAPLVAGLLGAAGVGAFDVGAACTGWLAGLAVACGQIESGRARHVLVIGADLLSPLLDRSDRATAPLFADGAGAAVICATDRAEGRIGPVLLHSDRSGAGGSRFRPSGSSTTSIASRTPRRRPFRLRCPWRSPRDGSDRGIGCCSRRSEQASRGVRPFWSGALSADSRSPAG